MLLLFGKNEVGEHFQNLNITFEKDPQVTPMIGDRDKELVYLEQLLCDSVMQNIVDQTNLYATQERTIHRNNRTEVTKTLNWTDVTIPELKAFIGCLILMGIHVLPNLESYWSSDPVLGVADISKVMTEKRFQKILENLHLNDNNTVIGKGQPGYDKLHKVKPLVSMLVENAQRLYSPSSVLSIDESMIKFKGRSSIKQYNPMKPIKRGYKVRN